ncbi:hypothetical protein LCGC14_0443630 [marine sediment metagenome]|uniref:Uncharacterized protein n=1 Tax=marine sediment metagenome TaxID=412755 RepID=A0A0F9T2W7_9ZZZZ
MATETTIEAETSPRIMLLTEDGRICQVPEDWEEGIRDPERLHGLDFEGNIVAHWTGTNSKGEAFTQLFGLTDCCGASFKGIEGIGVGCRACYEEAWGSDVPIEPVSKFVRIVADDDEADELEEASWAMEVGREGMSTLTTEEGHHVARRTASGS